ncbi:MAG: PA3496 family putative envelope integrity protein [Legionella sp.]
MSDLFEENDEEMNEVVDDFDDEVEVDAEPAEKPDGGLDARRRLELMLEEKRLRDELEDFDY